MRSVYVDLSCLQGAPHAALSETRHAVAILHGARHALDRPVELVGVLDPGQPEPPPSQAGLVDRVTRSWWDAAGKEPVVVLQPLPLTHPLLREGCLLGRPGVVSAAIVPDLPQPVGGGAASEAAEVRLRRAAALIWLTQHDLFFPVSKHVAEWLEKATGVSPDRVTVTGPCLSSSFLDLARHSSAAVQPPARFPPRGYVLVVGEGDPCEQVRLAVVAHARLTSRTSVPGLGMVIVGSRDAACRAQLLDLHRTSGGRSSSVQFVPQPSDDVLAALYRDALCSVRPSSKDGLALRLLEAVACGCPVLGPIVTPSQSCSRTPTPSSGSTTRNSWLRCWLGCFWNRIAPRRC